ncbi:hypothetical protein Agabi119p4_1971 [Agaricus bisporus var. burnettii]|uniref:UDP-N-acetylglucosamine transferase subunit ALG14 n=1 Tax=Agaricus bisporus var. burnettii TaxID=192524 RepID=A0A8H7KJX9_AGABI|nr:hypothetical protein Agabi119p4_1971 [Agaricus bisporus var. burnettii]
MNFSQAIACILALALCLYRLYVAFTSKPVSHSRKSSAATCSLAVFLGSGGHTSEALQLLSSLDFTRYTPRRYIISSGDHLSAQKAAMLERAKASSLGPQKRGSKEDYMILTIPRARRVHQSIFSTPPSALWSLLVCIYYLTVEPLLMFQTQTKIMTDVLVLNGPGTCITLSIAVLINKFLGLPSPHIIYVESFARVRTLSVSGRLLQHFADRFIVQWPQLTQSDNRREYIGWLI